MLGSSPDSCQFRLWLVKLSMQKQEGSIVAKTCLTHNSQTYKNWLFTAPILTQFVQICSMICSDLLVNLNMAESFPVKSLQLIRKTKLQVPICCWKFILDVFIQLLDCNLKQNCFCYGGATATDTELQDPQCIQPLLSLQLSGGSNKLLLRSNSS